ncbi:MAG: hypothetical protein L6R40_007887 [Gallowayella cf. fulva]|nr:MAG: hypothetical protein L6R40_007887 [Xanthomendoza cf. fulva]
MASGALSHHARAGHTSVSFDKLEEAFGPSSLGILIVRDLPSQYLDLRRRLLSDASYLASLPSHVLGIHFSKPTTPLLVALIDLYARPQDSLSLPEARYLTGWSHGKETLKSGSYDTQKGSFYVNCDFHRGSDGPKPVNEAYWEYPELTASNVWPPEEMLPGFQHCFEDLCNLIIDVALLVARACDRYAMAKIEGYQSGYLERVVRTSTTTKARLLHYFPQQSHDRVDPSTAKEDPDRDENPLDTWCTTHIDHGCLTGLTAAVYVDESAHPPTTPSENSSSAPAPLPFLPSAPDPNSGLYIRSRTGAVTKVMIPTNCLGFQTGETLQLITGGKFQAVPHFVRAGGSVDGGQVARNTLAVFTQPGV